MKSIDQLNNQEFAAVLNALCSTIEPNKTTTGIHLNYINHWFQTGQLIKDFHENYFWKPEAIFRLEYENLGSSKIPNWRPRNNMSKFHVEMYNSAVRRYLNANTEHHQEVWTWMAPVSIEAWLDFATS